MRNLYAIGIVGMVIFVITPLSLRYGEAALNPYPPFCEHQGYKITTTANGTQYCDFGDGNSCEIKEFRDEECGAKYIKEFPCVENGPVFGFEKCCEGKEPSFMGCGIHFLIGQPSCRNSPNIFERFTEWFNCFFFGKIG
jgi:hypothetical protein